MDEEAKLFFEVVKCLFWLIKLTNLSKNKTPDQLRPANASRAECTYLKVVQHIQQSAASLLQ